jgi:carbon starvation protein
MVLLPLFAAPLAHALRCYLLRHRIGLAFAYCCGITSKQLSKESHGFRIAYGGMIGETVMAVLSACLIITGFTYKEFLATGLKSSSIGVLFSQALGQAMSHLEIPLIIGSTLGALVLAALTLTTLDSFARTSRYVIQELGQKSLLG